MQLNTQAIADLDPALEGAATNHLLQQDSRAMKRGELYWADLAPRSGSEQRGRLAH
jgi:hypothetical protein